MASTLSLYSLCNDGVIRLFDYESEVTDENTKECLPKALTTAAISAPSDHAKVIDANVQVVAVGYKSGRVRVWAVDLMR